MRAAIRVFIAVFFVLFISFQSTLPVFAQMSSTIPYPQTAPDVPHDTNTLVQSLIFSIFSTASCVTAGINIITPTKSCLGVNTQTGAIEYAKSDGGIIGVTMKLINLTMNIPITSTMYMQYLSSNFHPFGQKSYAAGVSQTIGYAGLQPLLNLWVGFRNLAYVFLVIAFVGIGLAVMLRVKIDPRTVMTIQNQIPKIIIGIILITFSFAIAAFLVDVMYVITYLLLNFIATAANDTSLMGTNPVGQNPYGLAFSLFPVGIFGVMTGVQLAVQGIVGNLLAGIPLLGGLMQGLAWILPPTNLICAFQHLPDPIGATIANLTPCVLLNSNMDVGPAPLIGDIAALVVFISVIVALWKLWLGLIKAYLMILFQVTLGPVMILGGVIPGAKLGFGSWFRGLAAHLAIFPVVIAVFALAREFITAFGGFQVFPTDKGYFIPPGIGDLGSGAGLGGVLSFATVMLLPVIPDAVLKTFKAESQLSNAVGQGMAVGVGAISTGVKSFARRSFRPEDKYHSLDQGWARSIVMGKVGTPAEKLGPVRKFIRQRIIGYIDEGTAKQSPHTGAPQHGVTTMPGADQKQ